MYFNSESTHDQLVRRLAVNLVRNGFSVTADVEGFPRPPVFGRSRPDIWARNSSSALMIEVETPESLIPDAEQHRSLRWEASRHQAVFRIHVTDGRVFG